MKNKKWDYNKKDLASMRKVLKAVNKIGLVIDFDTLSYLSKNLYALNYLSRKSRDKTNKRLLTRKERTYIIKQITKNAPVMDPTFDEMYKTFTKKAEEKFILQIIKKIMAPQDYPL